MEGGSSGLVILLDIQSWSMVISLRSRRFWKAPKFRPESQDAENQILQAKFLTKQQRVQGHQENPSRVTLRAPILCHHQSQPGALQGKSFHRRGKGGPLRY